MTTLEMMGAEKLFPNGPANYLEDIRPLRGFLPPKKFRHIIGIALKNDVVFPAKQLNKFGQDLWYEAILQGIDTRDAATGENYLRRATFQNLVDNTPIADRQTLAEYFIKRYPQDNPDLFRHTAASLTPPKAIDAEAVAAEYIRKARESVSLETKIITEELIDLPREVAQSIRERLKEEGIEIGDPVELDASEGCYYVTAMSVNASPAKAEAIRVQRVDEFVQLAEVGDRVETNTQHFVKIGDKYKDEQVLARILDGLRAKGYVVEVWNTGHSGSEQSVVISKPVVISNDVPQVASQTQSVFSDVREAQVDAVVTPVISNDVRVAVIQDARADNIGRLEALIRSRGFHNLLAELIIQDKQADAVALIKQARQFGGIYSFKRIEKYLAKLEANLSEETRIGWTPRRLLNQGMDDYQDIFIDNE